MRAGQLDREITFASPIEGSPDAAGTPGDNWLPGATVRASLVQASTEEYLRAYGEGAATAIIFRIRWLDGVTTDQRITFEGRNFNVREIKEIGRRQGLELRCEEVRS